MSAFAYVHEGPTPRDATIVLRTTAPPKSELDELHGKIARALRRPCPGGDHPPRSITIKLAGSKDSMWILSAEMCCEASVPAARATMAEIVEQIAGKYSN